MSEFDDYRASNNNGGNGLAIASMILGIISIVIACIWYISIVAGIVAIVLGILHIKNCGRSGMSTAGIVCGSIGIVFAVVILVIGMLSLAAFGGMAGLESIMESVQ